MREGSPKALIVGAGVAGAAAALQLRSAGLDVTVVERESSAGGQVASYGCKATDACLHCNVCVGQEQIAKAFAPDSGIALLAGTQPVQLRPGSNGHRHSVLCDGPVELDADVVLLATGFSPYQAELIRPYGYGRIANVLTGLDVEHALVGDRTMLLRPSDSHPPRRVAFIQCVGSRSEHVHRTTEETDYCSTVCCPYALRMGRLLKHLSPETSVTVFYMDIQFCGRSFESFFPDCQSVLRFVRARPYGIQEDSDGTIVVTYEDQGACRVVDEPFDLAILSIGMRPPPGARALADVFGVPVDPYGFLREKPDAAIFAVGACESPKDIAGSIRQAEAVAARVMVSMESTRSIPSTSAAAATLEEQRIPVCRDVVVLGGGRAVAETALGLVRCGLRTTVVCAGTDAVADPATSPADDVITDATVVRCRGSVGAFELRLRDTGGRERDIRAGAIVLALTDLVSLPFSGAVDGTAVTDLPGLLTMIRTDRPLPDRVAFLLDATAEQGRMTDTLVLAATRCLAENGVPHVRLYCRHTRVAGPHLEALYRSARRSGVEVLRYVEPPLCEVRNCEVRMVCDDEQLGRTVDESFDLLVRSDLGVSQKGESLFDALSLDTPLTAAGGTRNVWAMPCETSRRGVFAIGASGTDADLRELAEETSIAVRAIQSLLAEPAVTDAGNAAEIDPEKCVACLTCVRLCPHEAIAFNPEKETAEVAPLACRRCGVCASECPARAIQLPHYTDQGLLAELAKASRVTVFACENSAIPAAAAAVQKGNWRADSQLIEVPCAGKVDPLHILAALERGAERVLVLGCNPESCRYLDGSSRALLRISRVKTMLRDAGLDPSRVAWGALIATEAERFVRMMNDEVMPI